MRTLKEISDDPKTPEWAKKLIWQLEAEDLFQSTQCISEIAQVFLEQSQAELLKIQAIPDVRSRLDKFLGVTSKISPSLGEDPAKLFSIYGVDYAAWKEKNYKPRFPKGPEAFEVIEPDDGRLDKLLGDKK